LRNSEKTQEIPINENLLGEAVVSQEALSGIDLENFKHFNEVVLSENLSDINASKEDINDLMGTQRFFSGLEAAAQEAVNGDFYQEISNLIRTDLAPEADVDADFFEVFTNKNTQNNLDTLQTAAASHGAWEESAEILTKKDKEQKLFDNVIKIPAEKNEKAEDAATLRVRPENNKPGKLDEMRNAASRDRSRRDNISFEVRDMRTDQNRSFAAIETNVSRVEGSSPVREITLELRLPEQNNAINQANTSWEAKSSGALENLLARELHQSFNGDIVRHASMALRDGGEGTIKIALKPESLGNVKIALELSDNKITGKILVESEEALNAFRKEIASLEQAFKDSGFASADLNLSLTSDGQNAELWNENSIVPLIMASRYEDNSEKGAVSLVNVFIGHRKGSINMLA
jgi:hypothetical protein